MKPLAGARRRSGAALADGDGAERDWHVRHERRTRAGAGALCGAPNGKGICRAGRCRWSVGRSIGKRRRRHHGRVIVGDGATRRKPRGDRPAFLIERCTMRGIVHRIGMVVVPGRHSPRWRRIRMGMNESDAAHTVA